MKRYRNTLSMEQGSQALREMKPQIVSGCRSLEQAGGAAEDLSILSYVDA